MKRILLVLSLLMMLCIPPVYAEEAAPAKKGELTYADLDDRWKPFFPEEEWGNARFLVDTEWEDWNAYMGKVGKASWVHYPILTVRDSIAQLHLFHIAGDEITLLAETRLDSGLIEQDGYTVACPNYWKTDDPAEPDIYREYIDLYLNRDDDPWNIHLIFECEDRNHSGDFTLYGVIYQFRTPLKTALLGQAYDYLCINPYGSELRYGYGYNEEDISDYLLLPVRGSTKLTEFQLSDYPANPDALLTAAKIDTKTHGTGGKVRLRQRPSKKGKTVLQIPNGTEIEMAEMENGWCFVKYKGQYGYVMAEFVEGTRAWGE